MQNGKRKSGGNEAKKPSFTYFFFQLPNKQPLSPCSSHLEPPIAPAVPPTTSQHSLFI